MQVLTQQFTSIPELSDYLANLEGKHYTLAISFVHTAFPLADVASVFKAQNMDFVGASSAGEFTDGDMSDPSIAVMLLDLDRGSYRALAREVEHNDLQGTACAVGRNGKDAFNDPHFLVLVAGVQHDGEVIINSIHQSSSPGALIFGGYASDDFQLQATYVAVNDRVFTNGIAAIVFDGSKLVLRGLARGGWKPIGIIRSITKSEGNKVYAIDNEPALDLMARYMHLSIEDFRNGNVPISSLTTKLQVQLTRDNSYPVMRAPLGYDVEERSVTYTGFMPEGARVQFSLLPSFDVVNNIISEFTELSKENPSPDAVLLFSCKGRQLVLGPIISEEVAKIHDLWQAPMAGFLSYGELGKVTDKSEYHGMMCSLLLIKEKEVE